jgi:hypothetical protein
LAGRELLEGRGKQLEEATQADLEDFFGDILRGRSANTAATRDKVLRVLYRWLEEEEELPNPMTPHPSEQPSFQRPGPRGALVLPKRTLWSSTLRPLPCQRAPGWLVTCDAAREGRLSCDVE